MYKLDIENRALRRRVTALEKALSEKSTKISEIDESRSRLRKRLSFLEESMQGGSGGLAELREGERQGMSDKQAFTSIM